MRVLNFRLKLGASSPLVPVMLQQSAIHSTQQMQTSNVIIKSVCPYFFDEPQCIFFAWHFFRLATTHSLRILYSTFVTVQISIISTKQQHTVQSVFVHLKYRIVCKVNAVRIRLALNQTVTQASLSPSSLSSLSPLLSLLISHP